MDTKKIYQYIAAVIAALLMLAYLAIIIWAGVLSVGVQGDAPPPIAEPLTNLFTGVAGLIAAHFAAAFGLSQARKQGRPGLFSPKWPAEPRADPPDQVYEAISVAAVILYAACVLLAWGFWLANGLGDNTATLIKNLATTGAGAFLGILAFVLKLPSRKEKS